MTTGKKQKEDILNHNEIILQLTKPKIISLLSNQFGERGNWSKYHWVHQLEIEEWHPPKVINLLREWWDYFRLNGERYGVPCTTLKHIKDKFTRCNHIIDTISNEASLDIQKTIEFPLIKGEGEFKVTKGFIDLIVHCKPVSLCAFSTYELFDDDEFENVKEFIIEVKTEKDFKDFGAILRQIKEYREYYESYSTKRWSSELIDYKDMNALRATHVNRTFCVLSTKIPDDIKQLFLEEDILCLELNNDIHEQLNQFIKTKEKEPAK